MERKSIKSRTIEEYLLDSANTTPVTEDEFRKRMLYRDTDFDFEGLDIRPCENLRRLRAKLCLTGG